MTKYIEHAVVRHYNQAGLGARIFAGLAAAGVDPDNLHADDLAPVDEFHIGGRRATEHAVASLGLTSNQHVLDVGCGIGGTARYLANHIGCRVTGIDLTAEYVALATDLTARTGLADRVVFKTANALDMPFQDTRFDAALCLHVAMNIHDRAGLYGQIARVMKSGARVCLYDVVRCGDGPIDYPLPWAQTTATSHLVESDRMQALLQEAGMVVETVEDRTDFARDIFSQAVAAPRQGPPPLGIHILMGASAAVKISNIRTGLESGKLAVVQMVARRN
ncbi:MAG: methyltransferase domain-containing protein [Alphaproteobacteria bacterium]